MKAKMIIIIGVLCMVSFDTSAGPQDKLWAACAECDLDDVKKWISKGADVNALNSSGGNSLSSAFFCPEVVNYLLEQGADPNGDNGNALVNAANHNSYEVMKLLLDAGADPDANSSIYQKNAAQLVIMQTNCVPCLKLLKHAGAKLDSVFESNVSYIHMLATYGMTQGQRKSIWAQIRPGYEKAGVKVPDWISDMEPDRNGTVGELLDVLLSEGCDINLQYDEANGGHTALMAAIGLMGSPAKPFVADVLLDRQANVKLKNTYGQTAIDLAKNAGLDDMVKRMKAMK